MHVEVPKVKNVISTRNMIVLEISLNKEASNLFCGVYSASFLFPNTVTIKMEKNENW